MVCQVISWHQLKLGSFSTLCFQFQNAVGIRGSHKEKVEVVELIKDTRVYLITMNMDDSCNAVRGNLEFRVRCIESSIIKVLKACVI